MGDNMQHSRNTLRAAFASTALVAAATLAGPANAALAPLYLQVGLQRTFVSPSPAWSHDCVGQAAAITDEDGNVTGYAVHIIAVGPNCWYFGGR